MPTIANHTPTPSARSNAFYLPGNRHSGEEEDGLGGFRGLRSALILETLAGALIWAGWYFAPRIAAWWGAR